MNKDSEALKVIKNIINISDIDIFFLRNNVVRIVVGRRTIRDIQLSKEEYNLLKEVL